MAKNTWLLLITLIGLLSPQLSSAENVASEKLMQIKAALKNTNGKVDTTDNGVKANTSDSLRAGPRGYNLLMDTSVRKKILHFDRERAPERVVHALGHGAYGEFESYGDWSNLTMACWLQSGAVSEVFSRFSVVVAGMGGSENGRDTHGFATKIYSACGNHDLVGNHVSSFFIDDGASFPDLIHSVKFEADKGFPTGGSAHRTAYDFFNLHPEGAFQLMNVLSDIGIPRDVRHMSGNGIHTYRFINSKGKSTLFKWYWIPKLGHRALVYDESTTIQGKNNNFQRIDLYENIAMGNFPEWEFGVQMFPDDGTFMYKGYDLTIPTQIIPFEVNQPVMLGKLTLNRNFQNFFAEPESISFAPSNVVDGVSFVPDPLLQWRLMSYDDTSTHRHGSPNGATLPINRPIAAVNNNYRDGYMQPYIYEGDQTSTPNQIGGVREPNADQTLEYALPGQNAGMGGIGRYVAQYDWFAQARTFWGTMDIYAQQHTVDAYVFELSHAADAAVEQRYVDETLNKIDNCLARRVAYGIGLQMPAIGSGPRTNITNSTTPYPSLYPLDPGQESKKSNVGLNVAVVADNSMFTTADMSAMMNLLSAQKVVLTVVAPHLGLLSTGINATASYITTASVFYDAVFIGSSTNGTTTLSMDAMGFVKEAYGHAKVIGALGSKGAAVLSKLGIAGEPGVYSGAAASVTKDVLDALSGPVRFFQRFPTDDIKAICG